MVGLYKHKKPNYNVKAYYYKHQTTEDGSRLYYDTNPSKPFMCKDNGFETIYTSESGHTEAIKTGQLETRDLIDGQIMPDDKVVYANETYIVVKVRFVDDDFNKYLSKRPSGTTYIDLRK